MHKTYSLIVLFLIGLNINAQIPTKLAEFKSKEILKNASIGILVQDMNGKEIAGLNKQTALMPASILKVVTTATTLETLGSNFRYETTLSSDGKRVVITGSGDPTLGSEYLYENNTAFLNEWADKIKASGLVAPIDLYIADNCFGYQGTSRKWIREDMGNYYAAGAYGISIFDNTYRLYLNTMDTSKPPCILRTDPDQPDINFLNTLTYNKTGRDNGYIWGEPFSFDRLLEGNIPAKKTSFSIKGDIPDPGLYLAQTLFKALKAKGVDVKTFKTARSDYYARHDAPAAPGEVFYTHRSAPLSSIIRVVNVRSNNHYAEHLIRTVGRKNKADIYSEPLAEGIAYICDFWKAKGLNTDGLFMYDGSGLAPSNAVTPELMCGILRYMYTKSAYSDDFFASLPKAGMEGTVKSFLKGTRLAGKVYVKSGSIANVQCFTGYYVNGDKKYVFTVMANNFHRNSRREVVKAIENLLLGIF